MNQPGETGPPELLSNERPESESKSSRTCGSMLSKQPISWVSIVSKPSKPSWLIWSKTASSRQPPSALCDDTLLVKLHTEAKGSAARPMAIPGEASDSEEPVDSSRKRVLCCWLTGLASACSDVTPKDPALVTMASCKLTSWLMALVMSVSRSDRRSVTRESKSYTRDIHFNLLHITYRPSWGTKTLCCNILIVPSLYVWITVYKQILRLVQKLLLDTWNKHEQTTYFKVSDRQWE